MTLFHLWTEGSQALELAGDSDADNDARQLLLAAFHIDLVHFLLNRMQKLDENDYNCSCTERYREMIARRQRRCPLQQILKSQEFMGLEFYVNQHVLIPRQDTEVLVELVLEEHKDREKRVLDLCTGSGCIAISLAIKGGYQRVIGTDISDEALKVARKNSKSLCGQDCPQFLQGDLFDALKDTQEKFDIITANPPYIPTDVIKTLEPEVRDHEPMIALDGAKDGLAYYRRIAITAGFWLREGGGLYLEIGYDQGGEVSGLLKSAGFEHVRVVKDLAGKDRVVAGQRTGGFHV